MLVVRELLHGPKRFTDLRRGLPAASPNALTDRLSELAKVGVLRRRRLPPPAASWVYELTDWGRELEPIVVTLGSWAVRSSLLDGSGHLSVDSVMIAIRTYYQRDPKRDRPGTVEIRLRTDTGEDRFGVWVKGNRADTRHTIPTAPDAVITTDARTLVGVLGDRKRTREALADESIVVTGDRRAATQLMDSVTFPPAAPAEARR